MPKTRSSPRSRSPRCLVCRRLGSETQQIQWYPAGSPQSVPVLACNRLQQLAVFKNRMSQTAIPDRRQSGAFEITNTSTGCPASNGRPSKRSSPCSPRVVALQCACTLSVWRIAAAGRRHAIEAGKPLSAPPAVRAFGSRSGVSRERSDCWTKGLLSTRIVGPACPANLLRRDSLGVVGRGCYSKDWRINPCSF